MRGTHTDITERKQATEALQIAVKEKTAMLLEIHHRVKNNLQIVASLLNLQARTIQDPEATRALKDVESRISSMALLHEALYRSGNYSRVDFAGYAKELCAYLTGTYILTSGRVQLERQIGCFSLSMGQSVPCGMILNELVSNALKHAFPGDRAGLVLVELRETAEGLVLLRVSDNGTGLPEDFDLVRASTLGLRLIVNLARQLGGKCSFEKLATGGAAFQVVFPLEMTQPQSTK
jgi:two-component sensor histidine kinase